MASAVLPPMHMPARIEDPWMQLPPLPPLTPMTVITIGMAVLGAIFYVASISMRTVIPLRIAGIASAVFFLIYGLLAIVAGSAQCRAYSVNEETMSSAMAQKLIERLSRWRRKA
jgi:hypothetical protein